MAIAGLEQVLQQRGCFLDGALAELAGRVVGFEADALLREVQISNLAADSFGSKVKNGLLAIFHALELLDITPVVVLHGLDPAYILECRKNDKSIPPHNRHMDKLLINFLIEQDIEYQVAPFFAHHQLFYLLKERIIDAVYSSTETLLLFDTGVGRVITSLNVAQSKFKYIDLRMSLQTLAIPMYRLRQLSVASGCLFRPLKSNTKPFTNVLYFDNSLNLEKGLGLIHYTPVLKVDGKVEPISMNFAKSFLTYNEPQVDNIPGDLYKILGFKLPDEYFRYQSIGLSGLNHVEPTFGIFVENASIFENSCPPIYSKLMNSTFAVDIKEKIINKFTSKFSMAAQKKVIELVCFQNGKTSKESLSRDNHLSSKLIIHQSFGSNFILEHFVANLSNLISSSTTKEITMLETNYELIGTALLNTLITYSLVSLDGKLTAPLSKLINYIKLNNTLDVESALLILLLFKSLPNLSKSDLLTPKLSSIDLPNDGAKDEINLISKLSMLYYVKDSSMTSLETPSKPLRNFGLILSKLSNDLSDCVSIHLIDTLLKNSIDLSKFTRDNKAWSQIIVNSPFQREYSAINGLMVQTILEQKIQGKDADYTKFSGIPPNQFKKSLQFVSHICELVELFSEDEKLVTAEVLELFRSSRLLVQKYI